MGNPDLGTVKPAGGGSIADQPSKVGASAVNQVLGGGVAPQTSNTMIVEDTQASYSGPSKNWHVAKGSGCGYDGSMHWTYGNGNSVCNSVCWNSGGYVGSGAQYSAAVFIPHYYADTRDAKYVIEYNAYHPTAHGTWQWINVVGVNQNNYRDAWVNLGTYTFYGSPSVYLTDQTGDYLYVGVSAMKFTFVRVG